MVPKLRDYGVFVVTSFRAVLFRMVPKRSIRDGQQGFCFRAVLFRMVPKLLITKRSVVNRFRAVLFRMVPKLSRLQSN